MNPVKIMHDGLEELRTRIQKAGLESAPNFGVRKVIGIEGWTEVQKSYCQKFLSIFDVLSAVQHTLNVPHNNPEFL